MNLVEIVLTILNQIKVSHWETTSYAEHKALDFCYNELSETIDEFIETYQGSYTRIVKEGMICIELKNSVSSIDSIQTFMEMIEGPFSDQIDAKDTDLLNLRDEILGVLRKTLYLLSLK